MRNKIISALATKFPGVEAKTLGRIADNLLRDKTITTDEEVNSAVEEVTFNDILKSYGDSRAAEATKSSVLNYEKKYGLKDGKPAQTEPDPGKTDPDPDGKGRKDGKDGKDGNGTDTHSDKDDFLKLMREMKDSFDKKFDGLSSEIGEIKKGKLTDDRRARFNEVIKGLKDSQKKAYQRISLSGLSDDEFDTLIDEVTNEVADLVKDNTHEERSNGFGPALGGANHGGKGGDNKKASDAEIADVVAGMKI